MKRVSYTQALGDAVRRKYRDAALVADSMGASPAAKPRKVPLDLIADQVSASMAVEGRVLVSKLTVRPTEASRALVEKVIARSVERRGQTRSDSGE